MYVCNVRTTTTKHLLTKYNNNNYFIPLPFGRFPLKTHTYEKYMRESVSDENNEEELNKCLDLAAVLPICAVVAVLHGRLMFYLFSESNFSYVRLLSHTMSRQWFCLHNYILSIY